MLRKLFLLSAFLAVATPAFAQTTGTKATIDPTRAIGLTPDQIQWTKKPNNDTAWVIGDPKKPGPCLELIRWHPTYFSRPHYHDAARYAVVLSGTWWVSTSNVYDPDNNTVPFPAGSVVTDLVKGVHYDGAKPATGDATIAIFMECPLTSTPAETKT